MVADQTIRDADANAQGSTTMADLMAGLPPLLLGTYTPKIDAKGRMALPAKFRSQLGQGLVMARGQERCVYLLPFDEFRRIASQHLRHQHAALLVRLLVDGTGKEHTQVFAGGFVSHRHTLNLRDYANLGSDVVVIGVGTRAELWNKDTWESYLAEKEEGYSDIADDVLPEVEF